MLGIYVHIPFCVSKCWYCDFFSVPRERGEIPHRAYLKAIIRQLKQDAAAFGLKGRHVSTVYFGGGTPSLMPPGFFADCLGALGQIFSLDANAEISSEVNPATVDTKWFHAVQRAGVTRVSIGAQSFNDRSLRSLGRIHSAGGAICTVTKAQGAGFKNVSIDIMYAIHGESASELEGDLCTAMGLRPEHISAYQLTTEGAKASQSDEEDQLRQMRLVSGLLTDGGWPRYEISNFARQGFECRHNLNYWRYGEYLGLGAGATSFLRTDSQGKFGRRYTQIRDVAGYMAQTGRLEEDEVIILHTAMAEFCFLGLRTRGGISKGSFKNQFGMDFDGIYGDVCASVCDDGLIEQNGDYLLLTEKGIELSNQVFAEFITCVPRHHQRTPSAATSGPLPRS